MNLNTYNYSFLKGVFMKKYIVLSIFLNILLTSCNVGTNNNSGSNNNYGILINGGTAPSNSIMKSFGLNNNGVIPINNLAANQSFTGLIPCFNLVGSSGLNFTNNCNQNFNYILSNPQIFGIESSNDLINFIPNSTSSSNILYAKYDYIKYTSPGMANISSGRSIPKLTLSGLVILPTDQDGKIVSTNLIKGVILYYHDTIPSKNGVMSGFNNFDGPSMQLTFINQYLLTSIFVSNGFIVIAPDYTGQGIDVNTVHPYIIGTNSNAFSGIYMLPAVNSYLKNNYNFSFQSLDKNNKLYITSFSEGGGYSLKATQYLDFDYNSILKDNNLKLNGTYAMSGAYDISDTMLNFMFSNDYTGRVGSTNSWNNIPGCGNDPLCINEPNGLDIAISQFSLASSKPALYSYLSSAILNYYYNQSIYSTIFKPNFFFLKNCINLPNSINSWSNVSCSNLFNLNPENITSLFNNPVYNAEYISSVLFTSAMSLGYFIGDSLNINQLINTLSTTTNTYSSAGLFSYNQVPNDNFLKSILTQSNTYNLTVNTPVVLFYMRYDSTVPNKNSLLACDKNNGIKTIGLGSVKCVEIDNSKLWDSIRFPSTPNVMYLQHVNSNKIMSLALLNLMK